MDRSEEKLAALQNLWDTYRSIFARNGLDIAAKCANWSEQKRQTLANYDKDRFDDLCKEGCKVLPLAILIAVIQPLRSIEKQSTKITGTPRLRRQKIRTLDKAAVVLEDLLGSATDVLAADYRGSIDTNPLKEPPLEPIHRIDNSLSWAAENYVPHPAIAILALRTYTSILQVLIDARNDTGVTSSDMLAKYLFSSYVYRATGQFHDSEVSTLIGAALGITYDETAHSAWRHRNYKRIDKKLSGIADIVADLSKVSAT
jgi:hypothetical protein